MTDFTTRIAPTLEGPRTDESTQPDDPEAAGDTSPFLMDYDTSRFKLDDDNADQMVGMLIALSNLL